MIIKVSVLSRSRLFREGVARLLEDDPEIRVTDHGIDGQTIGDGPCLKSDIALVDRQSFSDIPASLFTQWEDRATIILLEYGAGPPRIDDEVVDLISRGIIGGIAAAETGSELLKKAIKIVAAGELWLGHLTIKSILGQAVSVRRGVTRQESEIATLILKGFCNKDIGRELGISEATVKSHCNRLFKKFNVNGRLQLGLKLKEVHDEGKIMPSAIRSLKQIPRTKSRVAL